jgi:DNA repair exonuclease SbcCD ATPase subunit
MEIPYKDSGPLIIDRQKNPNRLIVLQNNISYEDAVAQSIIDGFFGSYEIWSISSYIGQGSRNGFLTASNAGKMELLNKMAFLDDDPSIYIDKIEDLITNTEIDYKSKLAILTTNVQKVQTLLQTVDTNWALNVGQKQTIMDNIDTLNKEYLELERIQKQREIDLGILKDLQLQLIHLNQQESVIKTSLERIIKPELPELIPRSVELLMNEIPKLQRRDDLFQTLLQGEQVLKNYKSLPQDIFTEDDYRKVMEEESELRKQQLLAQSLGVPYRIEAINEAKKKYEYLLQVQDRLKRTKEQELLREQIRVLKEGPKLTPLIVPEVLEPVSIEEPDYTPFKTEALTQMIAELSREKGSVLTHMDHLEKGRNVIQCPHCKGSVRYQNGILVPSEINPIDEKIIQQAKEALQELQTKISQTQQKILTLQNEEAKTKRLYEQRLFEEQQHRNQLGEQRRRWELEQQKREFDERVRMDKLNTLMAQLIIEDSEPIPEFVRLLTPTEVQQTHMILAKLSSIMVLESPKVSSSELQRYLKYQELKEQQAIFQNNYEQQVQKIPHYLRETSLKTMTTWIQTLRNYDTKTTEITNELIRLNKMKEDLEIQIKKVQTRISEDPRAVMEHKIMERTELQERLNKSAQAEVALNEHKEVTKERDLVVEIHQMMNDLFVLRQHATETECAILQQITDQLNDSIQSICSSLFDRDITIALSLYKTIKSTKHIKPLINFLIGYQGGQFDNINQVSGGEGDRISLALTLALNRLSMSPLIMLDESLASLDLTMKEVAIRTIREHTNNTVLIIMHDGIEGIFDNVLNIDDI